MKILIEPLSIENLYAENVDGYILPLQNYAVQNKKYFTLEEIKKVRENHPEKEIFISLNKNFFNAEIEPLKELLLELDKLHFNGIFFYDLAILELKRELNLTTDLVWSQTHMVNNYKTCNYYHSKGVKYALISKEITLEEILEIINKTTITPMVEVVGLPSVAFSKRHLLTNYYTDLNKPVNKELLITEKNTNTLYEVLEDEAGTNFFLNTVMNGTSIIKDLFSVKAPYIIMREYGLESSFFSKLLEDTKKYIEGSCLDEEYIAKYKDYGNTNFFFKKTIYKVKKDD